MPEVTLSKSIGFKIIFLFAFAALICLGLCGVGFYLGRHYRESSTLDFYAAVGLVISIGGVILGGLVAMIEAVAKAFKRGKP